jgi:hypothetical protein
MYSGIHPVAQLQNGGQGGSFAKPAGPSASAAAASTPRTSVAAAEIAINRLIVERALFTPA